MKIKEYITKGVVSNAKTMDMAVKDIVVRCSYTGQCGSISFADSESGNMIQMRIDSLEEIIRKAKRG